MKLLRTTLPRLLTVLAIISSLIAPPAFSQESEDSQVFIAGFNAYQQKDYVSAIDKMNEVLKKFPDTPLRDMALFWLSRSYYKTGNQLDAARYLSQFSKEYPDNPLKGTVEDELLALVERFDKGEKLSAGTVAAKTPVDRQAAQRAKAEQERQAARKLDETKRTTVAEAARKQAEEKTAAEKKEQERLAALKAEESKSKADAARVASAKAEQERAAAETARLAELKKAEEKAAAEKKEQERLAALKAEEEVAKVKAEQERQAAVKAEEAKRAAEVAAAEAVRIAELKKAEEKAAADKAEQERLAAAKAEEDKKTAAIETARIAEAARVAAAQLAQERAAAEQAAKARAEQEQQLAAIKAETARQQAAAEEAAKAKVEQEQQLAAIKAETARQLAVAEAARVTELKKAEQKAAADKAEQERLAAAKAEEDKKTAAIETARIAEAARVAAAQLAQERAAAEQAAKARAEQEQQLAAIKVETARQQAAAEEAAKAKVEQEQQLAAIKAETARQLAAAEEAAKVKAEQERLAALKAEEAKRAAEVAAAETARLAELKKAEEKAAADKAEQERQAALKAEEAKRATEVAAAETARLAELKKAEEKAATEKKEQERLAALKAEEDKKAAAVEAARIAEAARVAAAQLAQERAAAEQAAKARAEQEQQLAAIKAETARQQAAAEEAAKAKVEQEQQLAAIKAETARQLAVAEAARVAELKKAEEKAAADKAEQERLAAAKAEEAKYAAEVARLAELKRAEEKAAADEKIRNEKRVLREKAIAQYKMIIDRYPASVAAATATAKLLELGVAVALPKAPVEEIMPENAQVLRLEVAQYAGIEFNLLPRPDAYVVDRRISVPFEVINRGNGNDSFMFDSSFPSEFKARFYAASAPEVPVTQTPVLAQGEIFKGTVDLIIPAASIDGLRFMYPVKLTSRLIPEASQSREVRLVASAPLLRAVMKTDKISPVPGEKIPYRVAVLNVGSTAAQDVTFRLSYPPQLEPVDVAASGFRQELKSTLVFDGLQVNSGQSREFTVLFQLKDDSLALQELSTRAELINNELKTTAAFASNVSVVQTLHGIVVRSVSERQMVIPGQTISVPFVVTNTGNVREKFILASKVVGARDAIVFHDINRDGIRQASEPVISEIGPLAPREEASVVMEIKTPRSAADGSQGGVTLSFMSEGDETRTASGTTQLLYSRPVLNMAMAGRDGQLKPGDIASFDLTIFNKGSNLARVVELQSTWPEQLDLVAADPANSTFDNGKVTWQFKELGAGEQRSIKVTFRVKPGTSVGTSLQVKNVLGYEDQLGNRY